MVRLGRAYPISRTVSKALRAIYRVFTPQGTTWDPGWFPSTNGRHNYFGSPGFGQSNGEIYVNAPVPGGFGQPVHHFMDMMIVNRQMSSPEHFMEVVIGGDAYGGESAGFTIGVGGKNSVLSPCIVFGFNNNTGSHGWLRRGGPDNNQWVGVSPANWSSSPAQPSIPAGTAVKVSVRKDGNDWVYEAWINGVKIATPQGTYRDVNGAFYGVPGKWVGAGQWSASWAFGSGKGGGAFKGPIRYGDGQG